MTVSTENKAYQTPIGALLNELWQIDRTFRAEYSIETGETSLINALNQCFSSDNLPGAIVLAWNYHYRRNNNAGK